MSRVASGNEWIVNIDFAVLNEVDIYLTKQGQLIQHAALGNLRQRKLVRRQIRDQPGLGLRC